MEFINSILQSKFNDVLIIGFVVVVSFFFLVNKVQFVSLKNLVVIKLQVFNDFFEGWA